MLKWFNQHSNQTLIASVLFAWANVCLRGCTFVFAFVPEDMAKLLINTLIYVLPAIIVWL